MAAAAATAVLTLLELVVSSAYVFSVNCSSISTRAHTPFFLDVDSLLFSGCLMTYCCPCFAFCNGAKDAGLDNGECYCVMTLCGLGCCALIMLGQDIEQKRGLKKHDGCWHCIQATFDGCTCHSCRVVNECKVYAKDGGNAIRLLAV